MKFIVLTLMMIKLVCVAIDPVHEVFRPISMYQTPEYSYLGNVFVGLLVVTSILVARRQFHGMDAKLEADSSISVERFVALFVNLLALTCLLVMLFLAPIQYGAWHTSLAVAAMIGFSIYLLSIGLAFADDQLKWIAVSMIGLCLVPVFDRGAFGVVENCLLGFMRFYYRSLESEREQAKTRRKAHDGLRDRILQLHLENLNSKQISAQLQQERTPWSVAKVGIVLREAGIVRSKRKRI